MPDTLSPQLAKISQSQKSLQSSLKMGIAPTISGQQRSLGVAIKRKQLLNEKVSTPTLNTDSGQQQVIHLIQAPQKLILFQLYLLRT